MIEPPAGYGRFVKGQSVSVSGVCLTAVASGPKFRAELSAETLRCSTLGGLRPGDQVNLERALRWGDRLSGHFVLGHVDGVCGLLAVEDSGRSSLYRFSIPRGFSRLVVRKGSVALDGISLTVASRRTRDFTVAVIPETRRVTILGLAQPGDVFNFEADIFARYGASGWRRQVGPARRSGA